MVITGIECMVLAIPEMGAIGDGVQNTAIVRVHTDEGLIGTGESTSAPDVIKAIVDAPTSQFAGRGLREILVGQDPLDVRPLWDRMYTLTNVFGRRGVVMHAISAVDLALWDIVGQATGMPVWRLLGGAYRKRVRVYASALSQPDSASTVAHVVDLAEQGFTAVKLGWGSLGQDLAGDLATIAAVRAEVGSEVDLMVDVGMPLALEHAIRFARGLEEHDVLFLEEPLSADDLVGYARLREAGGVPIACGERETTRFGFRQLLDEAAPHYLQPDLGRVGGFTEAVRIADMIADSPSHLVPHCWSTDVLCTATLQFAAATAGCDLIEYTVIDNPLRRFLVAEPLAVVDGHLEVGDAPGLGLELNDGTVSRFRVR